MTKVPWVFCFEGYVCDVKLCGFISPSWESMFNEATFRKIFLPLLGNVNNSIMPICRKYADQCGSNVTGRLGEKKLRYATY